MIIMPSVAACKKTPKPSEAEAPTVSITAQAKGLVGAPVSYSYAVSDPVTAAADLEVTVTVNNTAVSSPDPAGNIFYPTAAGNSEIKVTAKNAAGKTTTDTKTVNIASAATFSPETVADPGVDYSGNKLIFGEDIHTVETNNYLINDLWLKGDFLLSFDVKQLDISDDSFMDAGVFPKLMLGFKLDGEDTIDAIGIDVKQEQFVACLDRVWQDGTSGALSGELPIPGLGGDPDEYCEITIGRFVHEGGAYYGAFIEGEIGAAHQIDYSTCPMAPGWNLKYKKSAKSVCAIYPDKDKCGVMITLNSAALEKFKMMEPLFSRPLREMVIMAIPMNGSKWLSVNVADEAGFEEAKKLIMLKFEK